MPRCRENMRKSSVGNGLPRRLGASVNAIGTCCGDCRILKRIAHQCWTTMDHHRSKPRLPWHWGELNPNPARRFPHPPITRVILTKASPEALMLWVKQLRRAPYSYDWIDNLGRPSPSTPIPIELQVGERIMYIFTVSSL